MVCSCKIKHVQLKCCLCVKKQKYVIFSSKCIALIASGGRERDRRRPCNSKKIPLNTQLYPVAPERILKWGRRHESGAKVGGGAPVWHKAPEKNFWSCPSTFLALKVQLVVLVSAFVVVSTVWSVSCLLFFYSRCPCAQPFVKVGIRDPPCAMESAPLALSQFS